jgi:hypothetical protein
MLPVLSNSNASAMQGWTSINAAPSESSGNAVRRARIEWSLFIVLVSVFFTCSGYVWNYQLRAEVETSLERR